MYVNGVQITSFSTNTDPAQNTQTLINSTNQHTLSSLNYTSRINYFDGYMTEVNFIDGQQLAPTSFGAFDATTGVWNPIPYTGTYGTNGFYVNFKDATSTTTIGYDYSGNSNNWTANNISVTAGTTYDSMVDTPTNYGTDTGVGGTVRGDYCVMNPLDTGSTITLSEANLKGTGTATNNTSRGTFGMASGQWYFEMQVISGGNYVAGVATGAATNSSGQFGAYATGYGYVDNGTKTNNGTATAYGGAMSANDIIGVAFDADAGSLTFYKNGVSQGVAFSSMPSATYFPAMSCASSVMVANFGQRAFGYTAPSGYKALCTKNLPTPTIANGANYMAASLYTGTGASLTVSNAVNSISFQPDLVWIKSRSAATDHKLTDSVRGATKALIGNTASAETTDTNGLTAFGTTGFTVGSDTIYNNSGATYVGWNWKGGGTAVSNNNGTIASSVSANTTAGFSVATYTGNGTSGATIGHGLGATPSVVIVKRRDGGAGYSWYMQHASIGATKALFFDSTNAAATSAGYWNSTAPTSTVFSVGNDTSLNASSGTYVAYCWTPIAGYSAFGSYVGNGVVDGPFIYCGFRPRYVLVKVSSAAANWAVIDSSRDTYNVTSLRLLPNSTGTETTFTDPTYDFVSNGFKLRTDNATENYSGQTIVYMAFAENPFKIARAR